MALPLLVFTPKHGEAMSQEDAPDDIHGCNKPATRRVIILSELMKASMNVEIFEVQVIPSLHLATLVHDEGFVRFLTNAWEQWIALPERCVHFFGAKAAGCDIPSIIPGNGVNRDKCQFPGTSVFSQACFYCADNEAPIYEALRSALQADMVSERRFQFASNFMPY